MNLANFETLYDMIPEDSGEFFTLDTLIDFAAIRFNDSISTNPYFYYGPVSGTIARNTGFCFVANLMANYSSGKPELSEYFFFMNTPIQLCRVEKLTPSRPHSPRYPQNLLLRNRRTRQLHLHQRPRTHPLQLGQNPHRLRPRPTQSRHSPIHPQIPHVRQHWRKPRPSQHLHGRESPRPCQRRDEFVGGGKSDVFCVGDY